MSQPYFEHWPQANKLNLEPVLEFNGITTRLYGTLAKENLKAMNDLMQCHAEQLQGMSHARGVEEVMSVYGRTANRMVPEMFQHGQHILDTLLEGAEEYRNWFEKGMHQFVKESKNIQEKVTKERK